jgi:hypothetical protein
MLFCMSSSAVAPLLTLSMKQRSLMLESSPRQLVPIHLPGERISSGGPNSIPKYQEALKQNQYFHVGNLLCYLEQCRVEWLCSTEPLIVEVQQTRFRRAANGFLQHNQARARSQYVCSVPIRHLACVSTQLLHHTCPRISWLEGAETTIVYHEQRQ